MDLTKLEQPCENCPRSGHCYFCNGSKKVLSSLGEQLIQFLKNYYPCFLPDVDNRLAYLEEKCRYIDTER